MAKIIDGKAVAAKVRAEVAAETALLKERGTARGPNLLYFETGQGSELSSDAHYGADQVTMEARCYGGVVKRTRMNAMKFAGRDLIASIIFCVFLVIVVLQRVLL